MFNSRSIVALAGLGYVLEELDNPPFPCGTPVGFSAKRFRPVTDVDITQLTTAIEKQIVTH